MPLVLPLTFLGFPVVFCWHIYVAKIRVNSETFEPSAVFSAAGEEQLLLLEWLCSICVSIKLDDRRLAAYISVKIAKFDPTMTRTRKNGSLTFAPKVYWKVVACCLLAQFI